MIEAVSRVVRSGGDATKMLEGLDRGARDALATLASASPQIAQAMRAWEALHAKIRAGQELTKEQADRYNQLGQDLTRQAQKAPEAAPATPGAPGAPAPAPTVAPPPPRPPARPPEAVAPRQATPQLGADQLTARVLALRKERLSITSAIDETALGVPEGDARENFRKALLGSRDAQKAERDLAEAEAEAKSRGINVDQAAEAAGKADGGGKPASKESIAAERRRSRRDKMADLLDGPLSQEWLKQTQGLVQISKAIEQEERALVSLQRTKASGKPVDDAEIEIRKKRIEGMQEERREGRQLQLAAEYEAHTRGFRVSGTGLVPPGGRGGGGGGGGGGFGQGAAGFMGAAGIGGRGASTALGLARGLISGPMAAAIGVGLALNAVRQAGNQNFAELTQAYQDSIRTSLMTGGEAGGAKGLNLRAAAGAGKFKMFTTHELLAAQRTYARATGRDDIDAAAAVALITGMRPGEVTGATGQLTQRSPGVDPDVSSSLYYAFAAPARRRGQRPRRGLFPQFLQGVQQSMMQVTSPFATADPAGLAAQIAEMQMTMTTPGGMDPSGPAAQGRAIAGAQGANQFVNGMIQERGPLGDMALFAMSKLQGTDAARRLQDVHGIDISTPLGMIRAASRASALATGPEGERVPEVADTLMGTFREFYPNREWRETMMLTKGMDPELIPMMRGVDKGFYSRAQPTVGGPELTDAINGVVPKVAGAGPVEDVFQLTVREGMQRIQDESTQEVGRQLAMLSNEMRDVGYQFIEGTHSLVTQLWQSTVGEAE